jgi:hypothetical protein
MKHYLDPAALAPVLSTKVLTRVDSFTSSSEDEKLVGQEMRVEEVSELKQSRYDLYSSGRQHQPRCMKTRHGGDPACWTKNNGGGGMHAAKLWQRMEEEARSEGVVDDNKILVEAGEGQIVYQIPADGSV